VVKLRGPLRRQFAPFNAHSGQNVVVPTPESGFWAGFDDGLKTFAHQETTGDGCPLACETI